MTMKTWQFWTLIAVILLALAAQTFIEYNLWGYKVGYIYDNTIPLERHLDILSRILY